ncbi:MAG: S-methyl-5'-thioadenosine phosphorylase [Anaerolineales bacterium]|nr:S-methyl-5'-thioadenosine phosphorylase [Anaerolineales bacterium]
MQTTPTLAVIGGSGLYNMPDLEDPQQLEISTPFGKPSAPVTIGTLAGVKVAFLARHGLGHHLSPSAVNYRANIFALKSLGVRRVVSISACGSLREDYAPGHVVIPDGLFDNTKNRKRSFFDGELVAHVDVADPFCPTLSENICLAVQATGATVHKSGSFITIEGPRFSTKTESNTFRSWGMSIIGMTTAPEAFLAREAELCYAVMAHVTDYDVWHTSEEPVTVEKVIAVLKQNTEIAQQAIRNLVTALDLARPCSCEQALANALITDPKAIPTETRERLDLLVKKYL